MQPTTVQTPTIEIADEAGIYRAPKHTSVKQDESVMFHNGTGGDVTIQFPLDEIFRRKDLKLKPGASKDLKVDINAPVGYYGYAVFCHGRMEFAEGGSMPIIIVNPKT